MPIYIEMPSLSDTMTEGTLLKWRIQPGYQVSSGQVVAEIQTDKAAMEMEAFEPGTVHKLYVKEGEKVPLGGAMAMLLAKGEQPPADDSPPAPVKKATAPAVAASTGSAGGTPRAGRPGGAATRSRGGLVM